MDTPLKARSDRYRMILVIPLSALCGFTSYTLWLIVNRYLFITDDPDVWNVIHKVLGHVIAVYVSFIVAGRVAPVYRFDFAYKMIAWSVVLVSVVSIFQGVLRCIVYGNLRLDLDIAIYTVVNIVVALYVYTNRNISPGNKKINGWIKALIIVVSFFVSLLFSCFISITFKLNPDTMSVPTLAVLISMLGVKFFQTWSDYKKNFTANLKSLLCVKRKKRIRRPLVSKSASVGESQEASNVFLIIGVSVLSVAVLFFIVYSFIR